jgi:hypothetical protein
MSLKLKLAHRSIFIVLERLTSNLLELQIKVSVCVEVEDRAQAYR